MSVLIQDQPKQRPPAARRRGQKSFSRRLLISTIRFVVVMIAGAMIGGGWYLAKKGFGREWRSRVVEELHKRGIEVSIRRLTLNPFRGLVAQDVRVYDYKNRANTLALVSEISLDINYAAFFYRQPFLNAIDIRNAEIWLPFEGSNTKMRQSRLKNFHAHVYFPPEQIYVSQAEGMLAGVRISVTGQLIKRDTYTPTPALSQEEWNKRLKTINQIVSELQKCSFPAGPATLQVKLSGDLAEMENSHVEATLRADSIRRDRYEVRDLLASAEYADQRLTVRQCEWADQTGTFAGRASWNRRSGDAEFQVRSSVDVKSLLEAFHTAGPLADFTFQTSPAVEVSGGFNFAEPRKIKVLGHAAIGRFGYENIPLNDLSADFSWDGERILVRDLRVKQAEGQLKAALFSAPSDFRLDVDSTLNPAVLKSFLSAEMRKFVSEWEWQRSPTIHLEIRGLDQRPESWTGTGSVALQKTRFRGSWLNSATSKIRFGEGAVTYDNLRVVRDEGVASGTFTYDFKNREVRFSNIKTSINPSDAIVWIDPDLLKAVTPYKFRHPPNLTADGLYQFGGRKGTKFEINVDGPRGMDYVFLNKTLPFERVAAKLLFTTDRLQINDFKSTIFGGTATGSADIALGHGDQRYRANVNINKIDFPRLTDLYFNYKTAQGKLRGNYDFTGVGSDSRRMRGTGKLEVTQGDVFAIPIFGPLSGILSAVLPGSGYSIARRATSSFTIKDGIFHTDDFEAQGQLFSMLGWGDIHFVDDKLNFTIRMDMHGPGILLTPMYKLFEYEGTGSAKHPDWHPKRF
ncbi:MAG TPA: AsmA-like C-terminal region-containing protein [Chthoniobacterales bacterium]|nr:AsmA-like C-terminal region-containing protein [Chthoniobacterales bacterium]